MIREYSSIYKSGRKYMKPKIQVDLPKTVATVLTYFLSQNEKRKTSALINRPALDVPSERIITYFHFFQR